MSVQATSKSVSEAVISSRRSELWFWEGDGTLEQRVASAPVSGDKRQGTSLVITASVTRDISEGKYKVASVVLTDDEGNVFTDAHSQCKWSSANEAIATVDQHGIITPVSDGGPINITATSLGVSDTIAVTVTNLA